MHHLIKRLTLLDLLLLVAGLGIVWLIFYRIINELTYHWDWSCIPDFIYFKDQETNSYKAGILLQGLIVTLRLSIWSILIALVIGTIMGIFRTCSRPILRYISGSYVALIRNLPPLVLIFIFYFLIGDQIMNALGITDISYELSDSDHPLICFCFGSFEYLPSFLSGVITLSLFEGAYITETVRAGIESIDKGQWEASAALGFSKYYQLAHIILPQAFSKSLPTLAGQFISTIKDSSIVSVISIPELTFAGQELMSATYKTFEIWTVVVIMYFILSFICSLLINKLEKKVNQHKHFA